MNSARSNGGENSRRRDGMTKNAGQRRDRTPNWKLLLDRATSLVASWKRQHMKNKPSTAIVVRDVDDVAAAGEVIAMNRVPRARTVTRRSAMISTRTPTSWMMRLPKMPMSMRRMAT